MNSFFQKIKVIVGDSAIRNRILFILGVLVLFRALVAIPIPGIDATRLEQFISDNQFFGLLNLLTGSGLVTLSIVMLGVGPYITASIIFQLMTQMSSRLKSMYHEEGEIGRKRFTQYARLATVPLAILQGLALLVFLERQGVIDALSGFDRIVNISIIVGGALLMMWLGELMTEFGIGNGTSIIIFAGIVASVPAIISQLIFSFDPSQIPLYVGFTVATLATVLAVVLVTEAERKIPVTYAKQIKGARTTSSGGQTYLPVRVNQAGVMPIIFALSILLLPQMIANFLTSVDNIIIQNVANTVVNGLANQWIYGSIYFFLVFFFTYFYTSITFEPESTASNLQKNGAFIPGIRPGEPTATHLAHIVSRTTFFGALFLSLIAILPLIMQGVTGIASLAIGGTSLLIVVSVVLDLLKKLDAQVSLREY